MRPVRQKFTNKAKVKYLLAYMFVCLSLPATSQNVYQEPSITNSQKISIKNQISNSVLSIVEKELKSQGNVQTQKPRAEIIIEFNETKLSSDSKNWYKKAKRKKFQEIKELINKQKQFEEQFLNIENDKKITKELSPQGESIQFGSLNISASPDLMEQTLTESGKDDVQLSKAESIKHFRSLSSKPIPEFKFDPIDYIGNLEIKLFLPKIATDTLRENVRQEIFSLYELDKITNKKPEDIIKFENLSIPKNASFIDWTSSLFTPGNYTIGFVLTGLIIGFLILMSTILLAKGIKNVASGISELKPAEESSFEVDTDSVASSSSDISNSGDASNDEEEVIEDRKTFDSSAISNALTSEMKNIRQQFAEIVKDNQQLVSELLRDIFYESHGLEDFRDLLGFAGYSVLKPAFDKLPQSCIVDLQNFLEDNRDENSSLLNGVEVTQRIYRDCITKITNAADENATTSKFREQLISVEDSALIEIVKQSTPREIAVLLRTLTVERGNTLFKNIDSSLLKEALESFDTPLVEMESDINDLLSRIESFTVEEAVTSQSMSRFILRLVRNAKISDEPNIDSLVPEDNWEVRREMMATKFFFSDLVYVPEDILRNILTSFEISFRGEFLFLAPEELKEIIVGTLQDGSKLKEMIKTEIQLVEKTKSRRADAEKRKTQILNTFANKLRSQISKDSTIIDEVIKVKCNKKGLTLPAELEERDAPEPTVAA